MPAAAVLAAGADVSLWLERAFDAVWILAALIAGLNLCVTLWLFVLSQQAVPQLPRLVRQRLRWAQGVMQNWIWFPSILHDHRMRKASRADLSLWLGAPVEIATMAIALAVFLANMAHIVRFSIRAVPGWFENEAWWQPVGSYVLAFGVTLLAAYCYWAADRRRGLLASLGYGHIMAFYAWVWMVAVVAAVGREARGARGWAKTEREQVTSQARAT